MFSLGGIKKNNKEKDSEEWPKEKELIYELIQHLEDAKRYLASLDSCLQASYHVCCDLNRQVEPETAILFKELASELASAGSKAKREVSALTKLEVKAWAYHTETEKKNKKKSKKKKTK